MKLIEGKGISVCLERTLKSYYNLILWAWIAICVHFTNIN